MPIDRTHNLRASAIYQLPFTANAFVTGWQVSAIVSAVSGAPFTPFVGFDQAGLQTGGTQRPNLAAGRSLDDAVTGGQLDVVCGCITGTSIRRSSHYQRQERWGLASDVIRCAAPACSPSISVSARTSA